MVVTAIDRSGDKLLFKIRAPIFVPGNRRDMLEKAKSFKTDFIIPDLEDSVPYAQKDHARDLVQTMIPTLVKHGQNIIVRINSLGTGLAEKDIAAVVSKDIAGISMGKIRSTGDVLSYDRLVGAAEQRIGLTIGVTKFILWIETSIAVLHAFDIARASERVAAIAFGAEDYTQDLGIKRTLSGAELDFPRAMVGLAARATGVTALDTPYVQFRDKNGLEQEIKSVQKYGYRGKFAIHPDQIETIRMQFKPQPDEIEYACRVVEGWNVASSEGRGSFDLDGNMIDVPIVERSRNLLAEAEELS